jgi:hypothetical protein
VRGKGELQKFVSKRIGFPSPSPLPQPPPNFCHHRGRERAFFSLAFRLSASILIEEIVTLASAESAFEEKCRFDSPEGDEP